MLPTLADGDFVIARRLSAQDRERLQPGRVVCVDHAHYGAMIKRTGPISDGRCRLESDGELGADAGGLGEVALGQITHAAWLRISPRGIHRLGSTANQR